MIDLRAVGPSKPRKIEREREELCSTEATVLASIWEAIACLGALQRMQHHLLRASSMDWHAKISWWQRDRNNGRVVGGGIDWHDELSMSVHGICLLHAFNGLRHFNVHPWNCSHYRSTVWEFRYAVRRDKKESCNVMPLPFFLSESLLLPMALIWLGRRRCRMWIFFVSTLDSPKIFEANKCPFPVFLFVYYIITDLIFNISSSLRKEERRLRRWASKMLFLHAAMLVLHVMTVYGSHSDT